MSDIEAAWQYWSMVGRQDLLTIMRQGGYSEQEISDELADEEAHILRVQEFCDKPFGRRPWWRFWR